MMAEIEYNPIKKIIVNQIERLSLDELIIARLVPNMPPRIFWHDGILFYLFYSGDVKYSEEQMQKGVIVCNKIFYSKLPNYEPIISINSEAFGSIKAYIEKVGWSSFYRDIVAWIKEWDSKNPA
jgi:hypothetical protein